MADATLHSAAQAAERLLPPPQAAEYISVQEQTLAVSRSTGRYGLPFVKVGRLVRYRQKHLDEFLERNTATQTQ